jgi:hypothetical protein
MTLLANAMILLEWDSFPELEYNHELFARTSTAWLPG